MAFAQIRERLLVVPAVEGHDIRSAAFRSLLLQRLQTLQFPDAWRGPGLEEIQDDVAPARPVQREAFSAFILDDDVRGAAAAAAGNLGLQRMGSWCRRVKKVFIECRAIAAGSISPEEFHANWRCAFTRCAEGRPATAKARDHPPSWSTVTIKRPANRLDAARSLTSRSLRRLSSASAGSTTMRTSETLRRRIAAMARATGSSGSSARQFGK
jgi:hypothetical protein